MSKADPFNAQQAAVTPIIMAGPAVAFYTVYACYAGGFGEVIATGLDRDEALELAREKRAEFGWEAWIEAEEGAG